MAAGHVEIERLDEGQVCKQGSLDLRKSFPELESAFDGWLPLSVPVASAVLMDAMTGATGVESTESVTAVAAAEPAALVTVST